MKSMIEPSERAKGPASNLQVHCAIRAKVIAAEGEFQAAQRVAEAAEIMSKSPITLQLRYLQTLAEFATEHSSTTVFPLPIDLLEPFIQMRKNLESK